MDTKNLKPPSLKIESTCFFSLTWQLHVRSKWPSHHPRERHRCATCWIAAASIQFISTNHIAPESSPLRPNAEESNVSLFTLHYSTPSPYAFGRCFRELLIIVSVLRTSDMLCVMQSVSQSVRVTAATTGVWKFSCLHAPGPRDPKHKTWAPVTMLELLHSVITCFTNYVWRSFSNPKQWYMGEIFGHNRLRFECLQVQPVGYMLTSFGFPLRNWGVFYEFL